MAPPVLPCALCSTRMWAHSFVEHLQLLSTTSLSTVPLSSLPPTAAPIDVWRITDKYSTYRGLSELEWLNFQAPPDCHQKQDTLNSTELLFLDWKHSWPVREKTDILLHIFLIAYNILDWYGMVWEPHLSIMCFAIFVARVFCYEFFTLFAS